MEIETQETPKKYQRCNVCNGVGTIIESVDINFWTRMRVKCPKCKGMKILDWVEMIVGVDESKLVKVVKKGTISSGPR